MSDPAAEDAPLPAHRVALRAAVTSPPAAFVTILVALLVIVAAEGPPPRAVMVLGILALGTLGLSAWWGLLVVAEQVAGRVPVKALRPPAVALAGTGAALLVACVVAWALAIYEGKGAEGALAEVARLFDNLTRSPGETARVGLITLVPFVVLGGARVALPALRRPVPTALVAAAGGLLAFAAGCALEGSPRTAAQVLVSLALVTLAPAAGGFTLARGERLEARLLEAWGRWRDRDGGG